MNKKRYIKPQVEVVEIEPQQILAGSGNTINFANDEDYGEDNVGNLRDSEGGLWAEWY